MAHMRNQRQVLGGAIRRIREATGLTLQDLANRADIDIGYLSRIESGHKQPSPPVTAKLANALSIDLDDISYNANIYVVAEDDLGVAIAARQHDLEIVDNARRLDRERKRAAKRDAAEDVESASA